MRSPLDQQDRQVLGILLVIAALVTAGLLLLAAVCGLAVRLFLLVSGL